jgi:hypothetical protein
MLEIPSIEKVSENEVLEKPPVPLTEDELLDGIVGGIYNKKEKEDDDDEEEVEAKAATIAAIARADMTFEACPPLLLSEKIEKVVVLRLQYLVGNAQANTNKNEIVFLDKLFRRIQDARRQTSQSPSAN